MRPGRSFTTRLIVPVTVAAAVVIALGLLLDYRLARARILADLEARASTAVDAATARIGELATGVESAVRLLGDTLTAMPDEAEAGRLLRGVVDSNPHIFASALAADPSSAPDTQAHAPYLYRGDGVLIEADLATARDPYWEEDWFTRPRDAARALWVEPYFEPTGARVLMTTFSAPLYGDEASGRGFFGVVTADVSLPGLYRYLDALGVDGAGFGFLVTAGGALIGAPTGAVIGEPLSTVFPPATAAAWRAWLADGRPGTVASQVPCPRGSGTCELRIRAVQDSAWSVGIVYARDAVLTPLRRYAWRSFTIGVVMLGLLGLLVGIIARRLTRPLVDLAAASEAIARGHLDVPLPMARGDDEVAHLVTAFDSMRHDLDDYIRRVKEAAAERSRLDGELGAARDIQSAMLPQGGTAVFDDGRIALWARVRPARAVGGDLYSFERRGDLLLFAIGDVSDKGIPAALFMARAIGLVQQWESQPSAVPPDVALQQINDSLTRDNDSCMFLTLTLGIVDLRQRTLLFASGGHAPPLLLRDGSVSRVTQERGPALGLQAGLLFPRNELALQSDDRVVLFTDGFDEARDDLDRELGADALCAFVARGDRLPLVDAGNALFDGVDRFANGARQHDDMTLLLLELPGQRRAPLQADHRSFAIDEALVAAARDWLAERWPALALPAAALHDMQLVLEEVLCNVRNHSGLSAGDGLALSLERYDDRVELVCTDPGRAFDPLSEANGATLGAPIDDVQIGGLGVHLITRLTDEQSYRRDDERNILRLRKYLARTD